MTKIEYIKKIKEERKANEFLPFGFISIKKLCKQYTKIDLVYILALIYKNKQNENT
jgi:hypothetical protein